MLEIFNVHNFKSLVNFEMRLSRFNVLIGMNGAGKSTILQAIDFMSQLMFGKMDDWLAGRNWTAADLPSKFVTGLVEKLVQTLLASRQQLIVTTHSPLILNYLDDATAREAVQFVYKSAEGHTRIRRSLICRALIRNWPAWGRGRRLLIPIWWL